MRGSVAHPTHGASSLRQCRCADRVSLPSMIPRPSTVLRSLAALVLLALLAVPGAGGAAGDRIGTAAGSGSGGFGGDGGPATSALLTSPSDVASLVGGGGGFLIADTSNQRIRRVAADGTIATVAGAGPAAGAGGGFGGDGLQATDPAVRLTQPRGVSPLPAGGFLIADTGNNRIRQVSASGVITTVAGTGSLGFGGDQGPATSATLNQPEGVAAFPDGSFLIADTGNNRIRLVSPGGTIITVAGSGEVPGFGGDGGPAAAATLSSPARVVPLTGGGFLIADTGNNRIRRVDAGGTIATVVGASSTAGFGGDDGPALKARLNAPEGVAVRDDGSIAIADTGNERVREVGGDGIVRTLAGTGTLGFGGDGGDPAAAQLSHPRAVAASDPQLWIADAFNHRVRVVSAPTTPPPDTTTTAPPGVSPPVLGRRVVAVPRLGSVLVRLPGTIRFLPLESVANLPMGSELDVGDGSVVLFLVTTRGGKRAKAIATGGRFVVGQAARYDRGQRPGELKLSGPLLGCQPPVAKTQPAASAARRAKHGRRLKVRARGRIRTRGTYGAATVRGTRWTTVDRCPSHPRPGTLVVVSKGLVAVRSFVLRRTFLVPAGERVLAPARR